MIRIPLNEPLLSGQELDYVLGYMRPRWTSLVGKFIDEFEECWAAYTGTCYGMTVSNGTTALELVIALTEERLCGVCAAGSEVPS
jgi:perosamine synthetase